MKDKHEKKDIDLFFIWFLLFNIKKRETIFVNKKKKEIEFALKFRILSKQRQLWRNAIKREASGQIDHLNVKHFERKQ